MDFLIGVSVGLIITIAAILLCAFGAVNYPATIIYGLLMYIMGVIVRHFLWED